MVLPNLEKPFPDLNLKVQTKVFKDTGFEIIEAQEAYKPIKFFDVGAFVWFVRIIEWEFKDFCVDRCLDKLFKLQEVINSKVFIEGTIHRFLLVAKKN